MHAEIEPVDKVENGHRSTFICFALTMWIFDLSIGGLDCTVLFGMGGLCANWDSVWGG